MSKNELPKNLSDPAKRALAAATIDSLAKLSGFSEREILKLHGIGPASIPILRAALKSNEKSFKLEE